MELLFKEVEIHSECGAKKAPSHLNVKMDGSTQDCCVTLYDSNGKAVFSMGSDEVDAFCQALKTVSANI